MGTELREMQLISIYFLFQTYPERLHNEKRHIENPLCPYIEIVDYDLLSPESQRILANNQKNPKSYKAMKLISDFCPRQKYLVHIENLQFYLKHGMILDKIHNIISFTQKAFAKEFIEEITKLRSTALTKFEKSLYKFINNVLFEKSMQVLFIFLKIS